MNSIIKHLALATRLLGSPVAEAALSANVVRDAQLDVDLASLREVLLSHGFENHLSKRSLREIPSLAVPVVILLNQQEAAVISAIEGSGDDRVYTIRQGDAPEQKFLTRTYRHAIAVLLGLLNLKLPKTCAPTCLNIICRRRGSGG